MTDEEFQYSLARAKAWGGGGNAVAEQTAANLMQQSQEATDWTAKQQALGAQPFFQSSGAVPEQPWQAQERAAYQQNFVTPFAGGYGSPAQGAVTALSEGLVNMGQNFIPGGGLVVPALDALATAFGYDPAEISRQQMQAGLAGLRQVPQGIGGVLGRGIEGAARAVGATGLADYAGLEADKMLFRQRMMSEENQKGETPLGQFFTQLMQGTAKTGLEIALASKAKIPAMGMITYQGLNAANQGYEEAKTKGFSTPAAIVYGVANGVAETGLAIIGQKIGSGGLEGAGQLRNAVVSGFARGGLFPALKQIAVNTLGELAEENLTTVAQNLIGEFTTVNPGAFLKDPAAGWSVENIDPVKLADGALRTSAQVVATMGGMEGARQVASSRREGPESVAGTVQNMDDATRLKLADVWSERVTNGTERQVSRKEMERVFGDRLPVTLSTADARTEAAKMAWQMSVQAKQDNANPQPDPVYGPPRATELTNADMVAYGPVEPPGQRFEQPEGPYGPPSPQGPPVPPELQAVRDFKNRTKPAPPPKLDAFETAYAKLAKGGTEPVPLEDVIKQSGWSEKKAVERLTELAPTGKYEITQGEDGKFLIRQVPPPVPEVPVAGYLDAPVREAGYDPTVRGYLPYTGGGDQGGPVTTTQTPGYAPPVPKGRRKPTPVETPPAAPVAAPEAKVEPAVAPAAAAVVEAPVAQAPAPKKGARKPVNADKMSTLKPDLAASLAKLDSETGNRNYMKIADLRARHPEMSREEFDKAILEGEGKGWFLETAEGNFVNLTDAQREGSITNKRGERLVYIRKAEPVEKVEPQAKIEDKPPVADDEYTTGTVGLPDLSPKVQAYQSALESPDKPESTALLREAWAAFQKADAGYDADYFFAPEGRDLEVVQAIAKADAPALAGKTEEEIRSFAESQGFTDQYQNDYVREIAKLNKTTKKKGAAKSKPAEPTPTERATADTQKWATAKKGKVPERIKNLLAGKLEKKSVESLSKFLVEARGTPESETAKSIAGFIDAQAKAQGLTGDAASEYKSAVYDALDAEITKTNPDAESTLDAMQRVGQAITDIEASDRPVPPKLRSLYDQLAKRVLSESGDVKTGLVKDLPAGLRKDLEDVLSALTDTRTPLSTDPTEIAGAVANLVDQKRGTPGKDSEPSALADKYLDEAKGDVDAALENANRDMSQQVMAEQSLAIPSEAPDRRPQKEVRDSKARKRKGRNNDDMEPMASSPGSTTATRRQVPLNEKLRRADYKFVDLVQNQINALFENAINYARGFLPEGADGIYDPRGNVVRTKPGDIEGTLHEQGHAIRRMLWAKSMPPAAVQYELAELGYDIAGEDINPAQALSEGTAEMMRLFVTSPAHLNSVAPNAQAWFLQTITPEQRAGMVVLQGQVQKYEQTGAWERVGARQNSDEKYGFERALIEAKKLYDKLGQNLWSNLRFTTLVDKSVAATGKVSNLLQRARAWSNSAKGITDRFLYEGTLDGRFNRVGKSLFEILAPFKGRGEELEKSINVVAQAIRGRALQYQIDPENVRQSGITNADIDEILNDAKLTPEIEQAVRELIAFQEQVASFVASRSPTLAWQFQKILAKDPGSYFPLKRRMDDTGAGDVAEFQRQLLGLGMKAAGKGSVSKNLTGSENLETLPILESIMNETARRIRLAQTRNYLDHLIGLVDSGVIPGKWAHRLPRGPESDTEKSKTNIYAYVTPEDTGKVDDFGEPIYEDKTTWYEFDPDWMGEIQQVAQSDSAAVYKLPVVGPILKAGGRIVTIGALRLNPAYSTLGVAIQDLPGLITRTQSGARPDQIIGKWLQMAWKLSAHSMNPDWYAKDKQVQMFFKLGLDSSTRLGSEGAAARKVLDDFFRDGNFGVAVRGWNESVNRFMNVTASTQRATNATEMALVGDRMGVDWDNVTEDQMIAMAAAANSILPMSEKGRWLREVDALFPLASVPLTATKSLVEAAQRNPSRVAAAGVAYFMAGLALAWKNKDEEWWKRMDPALKYRFGYHIGPDGKTPLRIDLSGTDFMLGIGQIVGSALAGSDTPGDTGKAMLGSLLAQYFSPRDSPAFQIAGLIPNEKNPLSSIIGQREGDIVPERMLGSYAKDQWDEKTGTWTKAIGRATPLGPKRFGHVANALTGGTFGRLEKMYDEGPWTLFSTRLTVQNGKAGSVWDTKLYRRLRDIEARSKQIVNDKDRPPTEIERNRDAYVREAISVINGLDKLKAMSKDEKIADKLRELKLVSAGGDPMQELTEMQHVAVKKAVEAWDSLTAARPLEGDAKYLRKIMGPKK